MINALSAHGHRTIVSNVLVATVISVAFFANADAQNQKFQFGVIGDTSYSMVAEQEFDRLMAVLNKENLAFVVHVGDFEADPNPYERNPDKVTMPCTDENFQRTLATFQKSANPFVLTPGDNDWADCHKLKARKFDPMERLTRVREMFFPEGRSLGQKTIAVDSQAKEPDFRQYRENLMWSFNGVTFATLHIVGSNNNKGVTPEMDLEHAERTKANNAWMKKAFADAKAKNSIGLVLFTQANPGFETHWEPSLMRRYFLNFPAIKVPDKLGPTGYDEFLHALAGEMETYKKPTLFVHGDTHIFRVGKPLLSKKTKRIFENFTRVETFGDPDTHWVRITVDPAKPDLFTIEPEIVPANKAN
jgi:Calcineurin-like phosphoesterase